MGKFSTFEQSWWETLAEMDTRCVPCSALRYMRLRGVSSGVGGELLAGRVGIANKAFIVREVTVMFI